MKTYTAHIEMTGKSYTPKAKWSTFGFDKLTAPSLRALKGVLAERYMHSWKHKRPVYQDKKDGRTAQVGYVVGFRADEYPDKKWIQQDWIHFSECASIEWERK